eukprot:1666128-Pyramimonas_sp.AAC.1
MPVPCCAAEPLLEVKNQNSQRHHPLPQVSLPALRAASTLCPPRKGPGIPSPASCAGRSPDRQR